MHLRRSSTCVLVGNSLSSSHDVFPLQVLLTSPKQHPFLIVRSFGELKRTCINGTWSACLALSFNLHLLLQVLVVLHQNTCKTKARLALDIPGLRLHDYIPDGAWIAAGDVQGASIAPRVITQHCRSVDSADIHKASVHPRVRWIGSFSAQYRLHPELSAHRAALHSSSSHRWAQGKDSSEQVTLFASIQPDVLHPNVTDMAPVIAAAQSWQKQVRLLPWASNEIRISVSSLSKIAVTSTAAMIFKVSNWLSQLAPVKWVSPSVLFIRALDIIRAVKSCCRWKFLTKLFPIIAMQGGWCRQWYRGMGWLVNPFGMY